MLLKIYPPFFSTYTLSSTSILYTFYKANLCTAALESSGTFPVFMGQVLTNSNWQLLQAGLE